jgi:hypothetical protein
MRRTVLAAVLALAMLAMLVPPVLAQTPKVTITGLFDQIMSAGKNYSETNFSRDSDQEWYARTRFRPDFVFEVGRVKAVLGLELDLTYGQVGSCSGGPSKAAAQTTTTLGCSRAHPGTTSDSGLNTDTTGIIEIKWMYTEFPLTGKDSVMPFIPVETMARAGLQPFASIAAYKATTFANGDFAGISTHSIFAPNLSMRTAYVMVEDENGGDNRGTPGLASVPQTIAGKPTRGNDFAIITSPEFTPFKGLDIKPLYSLFYAEGTTSSAARRGAIDRHLNANNGNANTGMNSAAAFGNADNVTNGSPAMHETRHTIGVDARWRFGAFGLDPTLYFQWGKMDTLATTSDTPGKKKIEGNMSSFLVDVIGSWSAGPLLLEGRAMYSPGNKARDSIPQGKHYFEPIDTDTGYWSTWSAILALSAEDFGTSPTPGGMSTNIGYDRYGRAGFAIRATYSLTPALAFYATASPTWTAESVDTDTGVTGSNRTIVNDQSFVKGDSNYIGTEFNVGMGWKFAPNASFDLIGAWLNAGSALDTAELRNGVLESRNAKDAYAFSTRVRLSF